MQFMKGTLMKMKLLTLALLAAVFLLQPIDSMAQYQVVRGVFAGGGGVRSGSNWSYDTVGQTGIAAESSGGSFAVKSGFWYVAEISSTVDVAFAAFDCRYDGEAVILSWIARADSPFDGFHVYRRGQGEERFSRISEELLPAESENEYIDESILPGKSYDYCIGAVEGNEEFRSFTLSISLPSKSLTLSQNYPNPFNPVTTIKFYNPRQEHMTLTIYDIGGRKIRSLIDADKGTGWHAVQWDGTNDSGNSVGSGIYYYRLTAGKQVLTKKLVMLR